jgi:hypothetical protein
MPDILSDAKAALAHANNFAGSVKSDADKQAPAAPTSSAKPSYTAARAARTPNMADEMKAKSTMVDKAKQALQ